MSPFQSDLTPTEIAQPSILGHSYAIWRILQHTLHLRDASGLASVSLGHSLGEYTSLVVSGSLTFADAIRLVHMRGKAMARACPQGRGGMVAIIAEPGVTLHLPSIRELCRQAEEATEQVVDMANLNSPYQIVLSGGVNAIDHIKQRIKKRSSPSRGSPPSSSSSSSSSASSSCSPSSSSSSSSSDLTRGILRSVPLQVSGPFHSRLMESARNEFATQLRRTQFHKPVIPTIFNVHANPSVRHDRYEEYLLAQLTSPVLWHQSILHAIRRMNMTQFIELGPSAPLTQMLRQTAQRLSQQSIFDPFTHPVDGERHRIEVHPSSLPFMTPRPLHVLNDFTPVESKDVDSILGGTSQVWHRIRTNSATTNEDTHQLTQMLEQVQPAEM